jgi:hypothetical protein
MAVPTAGDRCQRIALHHEVPRPDCRLHGRIGRLGAEQRVDVDQLRPAAVVCLDRASGSVAISPDRRFPRPAIASERGMCRLDERDAVIQRMSRPISPTGWRYTGRR